MLCAVPQKSKTASFMIGKCLENDIKNIYQVLGLHAEACQLKSTEQQCKTENFYRCSSSLVKCVIIYQSSKFSFSFVSLVESVSREIDEIRLSPSHQRAREIMHYSPVNNKNHVRHHENTQPLDSRNPRMFL